MAKAEMWTGQHPEPGLKNDFGKPEWYLLPFKAVGEIVKVLTFGAKKYSPDNWRYVPDGERRYFSALLRHLAAWHDGEDIDKESGLSHLAHAGCCLLFLMELPKNEPKE